MSPLSIARRILWSAAAALFGVLLFSLAAVDHVPALVSAFFVALAVVSAWRPAAGVTASAVLIPVATWFGRTWDGSLAWPEAVAVAFLLGYAARQALQPPREPADGLELAIHATIAVTAASTGVQFLVLHGTVGGEAFGALMGELFSGTYFIGHGGSEGLDAAMRLIEGLLFAHATASLTRLDRALVGRMVRAVVLGATTAAALNLWRIWLAALRTDSPVLEFLHLLGTLRYNAHYGDINAAGSYFVMALLPVLALVRTAWWLWTIPALAIVVSLMLSGSRAALLAGVVTIVAMGVVARRRRRTPRRIRPRTIVIALVVAAACSLLSSLAIQRNLTPTSLTLRVRAEYTRISVEMLRTRPAFGMGIGQYPVRLREFMTPTLKELYPPTHENAHNNFLQVLAELGSIGLAAFAAVIGIGMRRMLPLLTSKEGTLVECAAAGGVLGFVLTWFAGHPLLVDAPALSFWLLFGALAGAAISAAGRRVDENVPEGRREPRHRTAWAVAALTLVLAVSIPMRAQRDIGEANLEHLGIGVSQWHPEKDGVEYRLAGASSVVFVPTYATVVEIPLRSALSGESVRVEAYLDGRPADVMVIGSDTWRTIVLRVPQQKDAPRFRALEFRVVDPALDGTPDLLMIGKVRPRGA